MSLAIASLTTLVLTSVESDGAGTASGVNARSRAGSLFAIGQLGAVLQQGGPQLFSEFHMAVACVPAMLAVFVIGPNSTSTSSPETDPFGFLNQHPVEAGRKQ